MTQDFTGRSVVVVGAGGALGRELAGAFAAAGAVVTGLDRSAHSGPAVTGSAPPDLAGRVRLRAVDVLDDDALGAALDDGPPPWAVVNVIGGFAPHTPLTELDPAELSRQLELNLVTAAVVTKHALRRMLAAGEGRLVHTASRAARVTRGSGYAYSVSKLGVLHLVAMATEETAGTAVTVNCVVPSIMDTPANRAAMPDADHASWPKLHEVARAYLFLASPEARLVRGAAIPV